MYTRIRGAVESFILLLFIYNFGYGFSIPYNSIKSVIFSFNVIELCGMRLNSQFVLFFNS